MLPGEGCPNTHGRYSISLLRKCPMYPHSEPKFNTCTLSPFSPKFVNIFGPNLATKTLFLSYRRHDLDSEITSLIKGVLSLYLRISTHTSKEHTCKNICSLGNPRTHLRFRSSEVRRTQTCGEVGKSENRRWENLPPKLR